MTVTGVDDAIDDGTVGWQVRLDPSSASGSDYDTLASEDVSVTTDDDDTAGYVLVPDITLTSSALRITEGETATFALRLASEPTAAVRIVFTVDGSQPEGEFPENPGDNRIYRTFTPSTWNTAQLVTVAAVDDDVDDDDQLVTLRYGTDDTTDPNYSPLRLLPAYITAVDDDTPGLTIVPSDLTVAEDLTAPYTVQLETKPHDRVTVTVTATAETDVAPPTVSPETLFFDDSTWNVAQPVTVTPAEEAADNYRDDRVTLTHVVKADSAMDKGYAELPAATSTVIVTDTHTPPQLVAGTDMTTATYNGLTVTLTGDPTINWVRVNGESLRTASSSDDPDIQAIEIAPDPPEDSLREVEPGTDLESYFLGTGENRRAVDLTVRKPNGGAALTPEELRTVLPGGLEICLMVSDELLDNARQLNRPLQLRRREENGAWRVVGEQPVSEVENNDNEFCHTFTEFSLYAVGYEAETLAFGVASDAEPPTYEFRTGTAKSYVLEAVRKGDEPITYSLSEDPPAKLIATLPKNKQDGTLAGTATTPMAPKDYTLTAEDRYGNTVDFRFRIEVKPGIESRDLGLVLAGIGRTLATDAVEVLGGRFGSSPASRLQITLGGQVLRLTQPAASAPPSPSSPPSPLAGEGRGEGSLLRGEGKVLQGEGSPLQGEAPRASAGPSPWQRATGLAIGVARALGVTLDIPSSGSSPSPLAGEGRGEGGVLQNDAPLPGRVPTDIRRVTPTSNLLRLQPVSGKDLLARSSFELPLTRTGDDGVPAWTLWGRGSAAGFAGQPEDGFKMDGTLYSGYLGLDYRPQSTVLMGLAVAHSTGEVSYERTEATKAGADVTLTSVLPYVHWQPNPGLGVWTLLGAGWGEMDLKLDGDPPDAEHAPDLVAGGRGRAAGSDHVAGD